MSAARRAAVYLALTSEPALAPSAGDASALDEYCALHDRVERAGVSEAALAAAGADADGAIAAIARAMLDASRRLPSGADSAAAAFDPTSTAPTDGARGARLGGPSLTDAFAAAAGLGIRVLQVPRELLRALGADADPHIAMLRAAFSNEDGALIAAMASEFDVAQLRVAQRLAAGRPLRKGLATAGAAFGGADARERALAWSARLRAVRQAGRKKRGALRAALEAMGCADTRVLDAGAAADRIWESVEKAPPATTRARIFCDAFERHSLDDFALVPIGSGADGPTVRFAEMPVSGGVGAAFLRAVDLDFADAPVVRIDQPLHRAAAQWLVRSAPGSARRPSSVDHEGLPSSVDHEGRPLQGPTFVWPQAEPAVPVSAPAMTFSASRLNLYAKCARRWFYEYLCAAVDERSTSNAVYGKVFHAALESLHRDVRVPAQWTPAEVSAKLLALLDAAFGQSHGEFASQLEYEVLRLRARRVAAHYVRWLYEEAKDAAFEIVEIESRQQLSHGGHRFVGYIDRIDRPAAGGPITIFDYKTGRIEDDPQEYLRQVREGEEAQLALYYAMRRAQGDRIARIALVSIRDSRDKTWVLALDIADDDGAHVTPRADRAGVIRASCTTSDLERSLAILTRRCDQLTHEGVAHFAVGDDPPCSYCAYAQACRERPASGERIFAR